MRTNLTPLLATALLAIVMTAADRPSPRPVDFDRDIRPILSENCFACHGPDAAKRKAKLRLDTKVGAFADLGGHAAIVAGKPDESELIARVESPDPDERMPPPTAGTHKSLTPAQLDALRRWIASGADYKRHWAYETPVKVAPPRGIATDPIDCFLLAKLAEKGLKPAPEADRVTLIRRLSFDLTGLPPSPAEVDAYVADTSPKAYEKVVDRLLDSPHFGERMAVAWLDWVRYADTIGYHSDNNREVWLYRDYVINAFNTNKPFDRFTVEQLAGDLLPYPTAEHRVASGYNRMLMTTQEGGAQAKEYIAKYAADRVRNASTVWLGSTLGCAECHDHKFDPFTTKDFYRFAAFFADIQEVPIGLQPETKFPTLSQQSRLDEIDSTMAGHRKALDTPTPALAALQSIWERESKPGAGRWVTMNPTAARSKSGSPLDIQADGSIVARGNAAVDDSYTLRFATERKGITAFRLESLPDDSLPSRGPGRASNGNFVVSEFVATVAGQPIALTNASATFAQDKMDVVAAIDGNPKTGWAVQGAIGRENHAVFETKYDFGADSPTPFTIRIDQSHGDRHLLGKFRISATDAPRPIKADPSTILSTTVRDALAIEPAKRTASQADALAAHYRSIAPALEPIRKALTEQGRERDRVLASAPSTLVASAGMPRPMRILPRGNWLDETGVEVTPAVPAFLGAEVSGRRATRLDLAHWMVAPDNPLVARVFVNRLWKLTFGQGLVASLEDFGAQGGSPTHPELLDWLAVTFREDGWDTKRLMKRLAMTETYRRSSVADESRRAADPYNLWLARQGRFRLDAEFVRDDMLVVSGLLSPKIGGPSVKPYQPAGYWAHLNFPRRDWQNDHGDSLYRRAMYTYWMRSFLHPSLLAFDAPSREECTAQRSRSNTPLQALVLLNDPIFVEGARAFAERVLNQGGQDDESRLSFALRTALSRAPRPAERKILLTLLAKHRAHFRDHPKEADEFLHVGERPLPRDIAGAELAAWTSVARAILNLHETITRN